MPSTAPHMTHANTRYEHQRRSNSSSPVPQNHTYAPPSRPPAAVVNHSRNSQASGNTAANTYIKTSVSSATSGGSGRSELKPISPLRPYMVASQAEQGLMEDVQTRHSRNTASGSHVHSPSSHTRNEMVEDNSAVIRYIKQKEMEEPEAEEPDHAVWILFWLSLLDPLHSLFSCIFTVIVVIGLLIISPLSLCRRKWSLSTTLIRTVAPVFRHHLQKIYAPSVKQAHTFDFSPASLVLVHVASPFLSIGIAVSAWVAAVFWLFTLTMGNPDGTERRDDGRATVLMIRNWWERFLLTAIRR